MNLKIRHKLFLMILSANIFIVLGIFYLGSLAFSSSFNDYLDANREKVLEPLVDAVEHEYAEEQSWQWAKSRRSTIWRDLVEANISPNNLDLFSVGTVKPPEFLELDRRKRPPNKSDNNNLREPPPHRRPPPRRFKRGDPNREPPPHLAGRPKPVPYFLLTDQNKNLILGQHKEDEKINWKALYFNQDLIGYLGYRRPLELTSELDRLFVEKLKNNLSIVVVLVVLVSALIALILSRVLTAPILKLSRATHKVSGGDYNTRIKVTSKDEIGDLCLDFNRLATSLEESLNARQQWIADISHELRTPVSILQGELEAIQDGIREYNEKTLNSLHQEVKQLGHLISDLHELSMSDLGALNYQFKKVNVIEVINQAIDSRQAQINKLGFDVKIVTDSLKTDEHFELIGDYNRLIQLFLNLLNNSLSYTDAGGLIEITVDKTATHLVIYWQDSSPSVSDLQLSKLFQRLYRVESSRNRNSGGSGLGLSICQNIIHAHNGEITAEHSTLGGVRFVIQLPLK